MLEVMNSDYVRLARAKGLRNRTVVRRHVLRTALIPITTLSVLLIVTAIDGAVLTETVFQWRGLGTFLIESIQRRDSYAVLGLPGAVRDARHRRQPHRRHPLRLPRPADPL